MEKTSSREISSQIEAAIINNQPEFLEKLLQHAQVDVNMCLNNRNDSALFLAVKLSHTAIVKTLLSSPKCNLAHLNINCYSPLDLALVMVYDNQKEPRQSACWDILELLLHAGAEPACSYAMLYVIRNALKLNDDQFIFRLICTLTECSSSLELHTLFLWKLHRNQPMYSGTNSDVFFERSADFTVKLIKTQSSKDSLQHIVDCFSYYADSHWELKSKRDEVFIKLVVYVTIFGRKWNNSNDLLYLARMSPALAQWCYQMPHKVHSLTHLCRVSLASSPPLRQNILKGNIPSILLSYLNFLDIDSIMPLNADFDFDSIQL